MTTSTTTVRHAVREIAPEALKNLGKVAGAIEGLTTVARLSSCREAGEVAVPIARIHELAADLNRALDALDARHILCRDRDGNVYGERTTEEIVASLTAPITDAVPHVDTPAEILTDLIEQAEAANMITSGPPYQPLHIDTDRAREMLTKLENE